MELNISIFELSKLKKVYYLFLFLIIMIGVAALLIVGIFPKSYLTILNGKSYSWLLLAIIVGITFQLSSITKKNLAALREKTGSEDLFEKYSSYYKKKLLLNCIPVALSAFLFITSYKNFIFIFSFLKSSYPLHFFQEKNKY